MTKSELEKLWVQAGGSPSAANLAASVALAESSGRPSATDYDSNGTVDRGLWQINSVHGALSTYEPLANARAAVVISDNGTNFSPWVTYNSGAYKTYLGASGVTGSTEAGGSTPSPSSESSGGGSNLTAGGLLGLGVHASLYVALLVGAVAVLWLGSKTALQPARHA